MKRLRAVVFQAYNVDISKIEIITTAGSKYHLFDSEKKSKKDRSFGFTVYNV
jgi:hypothetical protein